MLMILVNSLCGSVIAILSVATTFATRWRAVWIELLLLVVANAHLIYHLQGLCRRNKGSLCIV